MSVTVKKTKSITFKEWKAKNPFQPKKSIHFSRRNNEEKQRYLLKKSLERSDISSSRPAWSDDFVRSTKALNVNGATPIESITRLHPCSQSNSANVSASSIDNDELITKNIAIEESEANRPRKSREVRINQKKITHVAEILDSDNDKDKHQRTVVKDNLVKQQRSISPIEPFRAGGRLSTKLHQQYFINRGSSPFHGREDSKEISAKTNSVNNTTEMHVARQSRNNGGRNGDSQNQPVIHSAQNTSSASITNEEEFVMLKEHHQSHEKERFNRSTSPIDDRIIQLLLKEDKPDRMNDYDDADSDYSGTYDNATTLDNTRYDFVTEQHERPIGESSSREAKNVDSMVSSMVRMMDAMSGLATTAAATASNR